MSKDLFKLKREFLEYCEIEKGQSFLTIGSYDRYLTRFLTWLGREVESTKLKVESDISEIAKQKGCHSDRAERADYRLLPKMIDQEIVRKYRLYVNRLKGPDGLELRATTQNHHILALRAFLRYLSFIGEKSISPEQLTLAKTGDREVSFLNREEYKRLLEAPDIGKLDGLRDKAMLEMLFSTGLRVSELCSLKLGQINFEKGEIAVLGKGKKLRVVFISEAAMKYLVQYLEKRGTIKSYHVSRSTYHAGDARNPDTQYAIRDTDKDEPVFLSNRKRRLNPRAVERLVQKYSKIAGITKNVTPHTLRHTFATDLLSAGADIRSVQSLLGHANISTTQVYTHVTDKHLREVHARFHDQERYTEETTRLNDTELDTD